MKKHFIIIILILIVTSGFSILSSKKKKVIQINNTVSNLLKKHQVLLTNNAEFIDHSGLYGASSFLVNYNNKVFAITAKHLIGEAGGVEPEIQVKELNRYFKSWKMFPRISRQPESDTVLIGNPKLNYDLLNKDILLLEVENSNYNILPLNISFNLPANGDKLYIIGCPYSEENCTQNIYEVKFISYDPKKSTLFSISDVKIEMAGFSGAPLVNSNADVVGVVTSGWVDGKKVYVGATFIKEIQNIK